VAVLIGALLIFLAGLATVLRGTDWPVMSARYDAPGGHQAGGSAPDAASAGEAAASGRGAARQADSASMWESLSGGDDPTDDDQAGTGTAPSAPGVQAAG
jgi:hypothetical protein